jgi:hypothetical protein
MKTTYYARRQIRTKNWLYKPSSSSPAETAVFATLGLVGMIGVGIAVVSGSRPVGSREELLAADLRGSQTVQYVSYIQFDGDQRASGVAIHKLLRLEAPIATNLIEPAATRKNLAMPTNSGPVAPKA